MLRLRFDSPAIDFCDDLRYSPLLGDDGDGELRGVDPSRAPDNLGFFDLGIAESVVFFGDGLESGDTDAWLISVP